jgi:cytidine deaminase
MSPTKPRLKSAAALPAADRALAAAALEASRHAYAPYSRFAVGAAVRTSKGNVHTGANLENAAFGVTICAEIAAITAAYGAGDTNIQAIAVAGHKFAKPFADREIVTPCGRCRQIILECAQIGGADIRVLCCSGDLSRVAVEPISKLLPLAFGPRNLGLGARWPKLRRSLAVRTAALAKAGLRRVTPS